MTNKLGDPSDNMESKGNFEVDIQEIFLSADFVNVVVEDISGEVKSGRNKLKNLGKKIWLIRLLQR